MHVTTGDPGLDGGAETPHPLLRFLLLRELAATDGTSHAWTEAHATLRAHAEHRVSGHPEERWRTAYHDLAAGRLEDAVPYVDARFGEISAQEWCTELCRLRRAPVHTPGGALPLPPRDHFDHLVSFPAEPGPPRSRRTKAVTRLLAASWTTGASTPSWRNCAAPTWHHALSTPRPGYGVTPQIKLLLANSGRRSEQWRPLVDQILGMTHGPHPHAAADIYAGTRNNPYIAFADDYAGVFDGREHLLDGQAMLGYDTTLAVGKAVRTAAGKEGNALVKTDNVRQMLVQISDDTALRGVTGPVDFDEMGNPGNKPLPLVELRPTTKKAYVYLRLLRP